MKSRWRSNTSRICSTMSLSRSSLASMARELVQGAATTGRSRSGRTRRGRHVRSRLGRRAAWSHWPAATADSLARRSGVPPRCLVEGRSLILAPCREAGRAPGLSRAGGSARTGRRGRGRAHHCRRSGRVAVAAAAPAAAALSDLGLGGGARSQPEARVAEDEAVDGGEDQQVPRTRRHFRLPRVRGEAWARRRRPHEMAALLPICSPSRWRRAGTHGCSRPPSSTGAAGAPPP
eukprot:scaffold4384_cov367-Prasinococcus_capsulatus_cf.AAC.14